MNTKLTNILIQNEIADETDIDFDEPTLIEELGILTPLDFEILLKDEK